MKATMKILGAFCVIMTCSTASWASGYFEAQPRDYESDPEDYTCTNRGDYLREKKKTYTTEELLSVRESTDGDPATMARIKAILSGMGILKISPGENK